MTCGVIFQTSSRIGRNSSGGIGQTLIWAATSVSVTLPRNDAKASPPLLVEGSQVGVVEKLKLPCPNWLPSWLY